MRFHSDKELLEKIALDDSSAFEELYAHYWRIMFSAAYQVLNDEDLCLDVVQEVFLWVWENRAKLTIKQSAKNYLITAVKYKIANHIKKSKLQTAFIEKLEEAEAPSAQELLEIKELHQAYEYFTQTLPPKCKEVFILSRNDDLTNKQVAKHLGISEKTVENQLTIAYRKIRVLLTRRFKIPTKEPQPPFQSQGEHKVAT